MVGLTACNALSEIFEIISFRYGEKSKISFNEGILQGTQTKSKIRDTEKHGTVFVLKPSKTYMGDDCEIITDNLVEWLDKISYLLPQGIEIKLGIKKKGKESVLKKTYKNKYGLYDLVNKYCNKPLTDPIHLMDTMILQEKVHERIIDRSICLEVAFTYNASSVEFEAMSFCNFINTVDHGSHVEAVKTAILQYLTKMTRDSLSERESKKLDITFSDATQGLYLSVYLATDMNMQFASQ